MAAVLFSAKLRPGPNGDATSVHFAERENSCRLMEMCPLLCGEVAQATDKAGVVSSSMRIRWHSSIEFIRRDYFDQNTCVGYFSQR